MTILELFCKSGKPFGKNIDIVSQISFTCQTLIHLMLRPGHPTPKIFVVLSASYLIVLLDAHLIGIIAVGGCE